RRIHDDAQLLYRHSLMDVHTCAFRLYTTRMLLVRTHLAPSSIHGIGLFATESITQGTLMWKLHPKIDVFFTDEELEALPELVQKMLDDHIYEMAGLPYWVLDGDASRYMNHSRQPNMGPAGDVFEWV